MAVPLHFRDLPAWVDQGRLIRQIEVAREVADAFKHSPVVMLSAPTGTGKTLLGEMVRREIGARALYTCVTRSLQDQMAEDFPYTKVLKGRVNYPTLRFPKEFTAPDPITAADCNRQGDECSFCDEVGRCPYQIAKGEALNADVATVNLAYLLNEWNQGGLGGGKAGRFSGRELVVLDEADEIEKALLNYIEVRVSARTITRFNLGWPKKTVVESWRAWMVKATMTLTRTLEGMPPPPPMDRAAVTYRRYLTELTRRLREIAPQLGEGWVHERQGTTLIFRPVWVDKFAGALLWRHAQRFLLMSGSIIAPSQMAADLGLDDYQVVEVESEFDPEHRPVYPLPYASVTKKTQEQAWPKVARGCAEVASLYPTERVLIHAVSYDFARYITEKLEVRLPDRKILSYTSAKERDASLARFKATPNAVLVAPSMERGIDLPDDYCRAIIIAKVPYPNLGDAQVSKRFYGGGAKGKGWFASETIRTVVQMTGRGVRHHSDWCETWILDEQFSRLWEQHKRWFPKWWRDAVQPKLRSERVMKKRQLEIGGNRVAQ